MSDQKAMTLAQFAKESKSKATKKLIRAILTPYSILNDIPLVTLPSMKAQVLQLLPEGLQAFNGWGSLNADPNYFNAEFADHEESTYLIRQMIQVERRFLMMKDQLIQDPFQARFQVWRETLNYELNTTFIYNDPTAPTGNKKAWSGLKYRHLNTKKFKTPAVNRIDCGGLDLSGTITSAIGNKLMELLGIGFALMGAPGGEGVTAYTNYIAKERMGTCIRAMGAGAGWATDKDALGRSFEKYREATIRDLGFRADSATPVITNTQDATGAEVGNGTYTSINMVHWGEGQMRGWQTNELEPEHLGRSIEKGNYENVYIDWGVGLIQENPRSICELYNIKIN